MLQRGRKNVHKVASCSTDAYVCTRWQQNENEQEREGGREIERAVIICFRLMFIIYLWLQLFLRLLLTINGPITRIVPAKSVRMAGIISVINYSGSLEGIESGWNFLFCFFFLFLSSSIFASSVNKNECTQIKSAEFRIHSPDGWRSIEHVAKFIDEIAMSGCVAMLMPVHAWFWWESKAVSATWFDWKAHFADKQTRSHASQLLVCPASGHHVANWI